MPSLKITDGAIPKAERLRLSSGRILYQISPQTALHPNTTRNPQVFIDDDRALVLEQRLGEIWLCKPRAPGFPKRLYMTLPHFYGEDETGGLGLAIDPDWREPGGKRFYVYFGSTATGKIPAGMRISRFQHHGNLWAREEHKSRPNRGRPAVILRRFRAPKFLHLPALSLSAFYSIQPGPRCRKLWRAVVTW